MTPPRNGSSELKRSVTAKHLAAHTIFALRAGFCVERVALNEAANAHGVTCSWKQAREAYGNDTKLIHRGFALAYIGGIIDQDHLEHLSDDLHAEMHADMAASEDCRETAVAWNLVSSVKETTPFAHVGYKLASRLIKKDRPVIEKLAALLLEREALDQAALLTWFEENASSYPLDELEKTNTY